jgi:hypothetical protein
MAYFYNVLNLAGINAMVVFLLNPQWEDENSSRRRTFIHSLGLQLLDPWLQKRVEIQQLQKATRRALEICGYKLPTTAHPEQVVPLGGRKRASFCMSNHGGRENY